jgi:predicted HTH domain antitoxin
LKKFESREQVVEALRQKKSLASYDLGGLDLSGLRFIGIKMGGARLREANLKEALLVGVNLAGADLSGARLETARVIFSNLEGVNLIGADLQAAQMNGVSLKDSDLRGANLCDSKLLNLNVKGADFGGANANGAYFSGVDWERARALPDEVPEQLPGPPPWLPALVVGLLALGVILVVRKKKRQYDLRVRLAVHQYQTREISLAKAASLAGVSWAQMKDILLERGVQPRLGPETIEQTQKKEVQVLREHL